MINDKSNLPISLDIIDIHKRNENITLDIFNNKFTLSVGGHTRSIQPYELIRFVGSIKNTELNTIRTIPSSPISFGNIVGTILHAHVRKYVFRWGHDRMESAFGEYRYIKKDIGIWSMSKSELIDNIHSVDDEYMVGESRDDYFKVYGIDDNLIMPTEENTSAYFCRMFQPEFLLINNGNISGGGFIYSLEQYDYITHAFRSEYTFNEVQLIPEATNTYSSGKLCIQKAETMSDAIHQYYSDIYNTDLLKSYFKAMVNLQYNYANNNDLSTTKFFSELEREVSLDHLGVYGIIQENLL